MKEMDGVGLARKPRDSMNLPRPPEQRRTLCGQDRTLVGRPAFPPVTIEIKATLGQMQIWRMFDVLS